MLLVTIPAFRLILARTRPVLAEEFDLPKKESLDTHLLGGSALFGVGWGLADIEIRGFYIYGRSRGCLLRGLRAGHNCFEDRGA